MELLARISRTKYLETEKEKKISKGMERLIKEVILENFAWEPWQEFRTEKMYKYEVNDILKVNIEGLKEIMDRYHQPK